MPEYTAKTRIPPLTFTHACPILLSFLGMDVTAPSCLSTTAPNQVTINCHKESSRRVLAILSFFVELLHLLLPHPVLNPKEDTEGALVPSHVPRRTIQHRTSQHCRWLLHFIPALRFLPSLIAKNPSLRPPGTGGPYSRFAGFLCSQSLSPPAPSSCDCSFPDYPSSTRTGVTGAG